MEKLSKIFIHNDYSASNTDGTKDKIDIGISRRVKNFPRKTNKKTRKLSFIILGIALVIILIIVSAVYLSDDDIGLFLPSKSGLILISNNRFWFFNIETNNFTQLMECSNPIRAFDIYQNKAILWSENDEPIIKSSSEIFKNITHTKRWNPQRIAVDHITENVYIIHKSTGTLNVIDKKGDKYNVILSELKDPNDLALDVKDGIIFIGQQSGPIIRVSMDGTNMTTIKSDSGSSLITIDPDNKKIYWVNDYSIIMSANYEGKEMKKIAEYQHPLKGLTFIDGKLFLLITENSYPNTNATLLSCQIEEHECKKFQKYQIPFDNPQSLKALHNRHYSRLKIENPCRKKNCSDLCLLSMNGLSKCSCKLGWQLNEDLKTCRPITEFFLFILNNTIRAQNLNSKINDSFTNFILPVEFDIGFNRDMKMINFDYNMKSGVFYFSNVTCINKINLINEDDQTVIFEIKSDHMITDIAIDWLSNNLFYIVKSNSLDENHAIMVMSLNNYTLHKTIKSFPVIDLNLGGCPYSLIVHPNLSKLFFTIYDGRINLNSISIMNISDIFKISEIHYYNGYELLALDYEMEKLYISRNRDLRIISYIDLNSQSEGFLDNTPVSVNIPKIISIFVYGDYVYIGNDSEIWEFDKETGKNKIKIFPKFGNVLKEEQKLYGLKIYGPKIQNLTNEEYCHVNDCEQFCFAKPQKKCVCSNSYDMRNLKYCVQ